MSTESILLIGDADCARRESGLEERVDQASSNIPDSRVAGFTRPPSDTTQREIGERQAAWRAKGRRHPRAQLHRLAGGGRAVPTPSPHRSRMTRRAIANTSPRSKSQLAGEKAQCAAGRERGAQL
jgi:hypothetical protein